MQLKKLSDSGRTRQALFILAVFLFSVAAAVPVLGQSIRIMPLGDSITYDNYTGDMRPPEMRTGYRQLLWLDLVDAGYNIDFVGSLSSGQYAVPPFDPAHEGHPGWSDAETAIAVSMRFFTTIRRM